METKNVIPSASPGIGRITTASPSTRFIFCFVWGLFIILSFSWFSALEYSDHHPDLLFRYTLVPSSNQLFSNITASQIIPLNHTHSDIDPSTKNRSILVDNQEEEEEEAAEETTDHGERTDPTDTILCTPTYNIPILKVYMYDLPPEFHFELLDWKASRGVVWPDIRTNKVIPSYPGGLNLQHSIEYWMILDLLISSELSGGRSAIRVHNSSEADIIFVPFLSSLSYNRHSKTHHEKKSTDRLLQEKLIRYLMNKEEWKRSGGRDHLIPAHHPNSLMYARTKLYSAMFVLCDFGRYPPNIANVDKDVIAPYKHVIKTFEDDATSFHTRPTLLFFQGAVHRKAGGFIRQDLFNLLKNEKEVHFSHGSVRRDGNGIKKSTTGMRSSKFCLNIEGDTPSSNRLFDAIASHCVPIIISDNIELPYEDVLDYSQFCIFVRTADALKNKFLINYIRSIGEDEWTRMWRRLKEVDHKYEFQYPSKEGDAVQMIWQAVARKVPPVRRNVHKSKRFSHRHR